jgi:hypothetical protein
MFYEEMARLLADERAERVERELHVRELARQAREAERTLRSPLRLAIGRILIRFGGWLANPSASSHPSTTNSR